MDARATVDVALVDDHPLLMLGLINLLERAGLRGMAVEVQPAPTLVTSVLAAGARCAVVDLGLPLEGGGLGLIGPLVSVGLRVVVLTGEHDVALRAACLRAGARAVLGKDEELDDIVAAIVAVAQGQEVRPQQRAMVLAQAQRLADDRSRALAPFQTLSPREQEILAAIVEGESPAEIAAHDFVSVQTVRSQVKTVFRKLGVRSQLEAAAKARQSGWAPAPTRSSRRSG